MQYIIWSSDALVKFLVIENERSFTMCILFRDES